MDDSMDETFLDIVKLPEFTPDAFQLQDQEAHLVFDAGPPMRDSQVICSAWTVERMTLLHAYKGVLPIRLGQMPRARIGGTLYAMSGDEIEKLDKKRQNGVYFQRETVEVLFETKAPNPVCEYLPSFVRTTNRVPGKVMMWTGRPEYWTDIVQMDHFRTHSKGKQTAESNFQLADTFPDYELRELHNHYRYSGVKVEDAFMAEPRIIKPWPVGYIRKKNDREVSRVTPISTKVLRPVDFLLKAAIKAVSFPAQPAEIVLAPRVLITKDKEGRVWSQFTSKE